jgi:CheY-like chemotaxis protein
MSGAADHAEPGADGRAPQAEQPLRGMKALVVDDEPDARELVKMILESAGAAVTAVDSARAALATVDLQCPTVLVTDIGMPGQDGFRLLRELRSRGIRIPAVAVTAYGRREDRQRALRAGFRHHVPKPIDPVLLIDIITSVRDAPPQA